MTFYPDLSNYEYRNEVGSALNVGWLGWRNPFYPRGPVPQEVVEKLKVLALRREGQTRGYHECPFCVMKFRARHFIRVGSDEMILGSAEVRVDSGRGEIYMAPNLIIHYIEKHSYRPPNEFIDALMLQV